MPITLAFDVYGTLIDTHGLVDRLQVLMGTQAREFSQTWRDKQLEYSFRRGLMQNYATFAVCTANALDYTDQLYATHLSHEDKLGLLTAYRTLPAFSDTAPGLDSLRNDGCRLYAFSNGTADAVEMLLKNAGIDKRFEGIVSVDELKSFKPNPAVYAHFLRRSDTKACESWLISSNPFDVIGAMSAGMRAAWVKRTENAVFDPWDMEPTATIRDLSELPSVIGE